MIEFLLVKDPHLYLEHINKYNMDQINLLFKDLINVKITTIRDKNKIKVNVNYKMLLSSN